MVPGQPIPLSGQPRSQDISFWLKDLVNVVNLANDDRKVYWHRQHLPTVRLGAQFPLSGMIRNG